MRASKRRDELCSCAALCMHIQNWRNFREIECRHLCWQGSLRGEEEGTRVNKDASVDALCEPLGAHNRNAPEGGVVELVACGCVREQVRASPREVRRVAAAVLAHEALYCRARRSRQAGDAQREAGKWLQEKVLHTHTRVG